MKLKVNFLSGGRGGRYWQAGEEIPDEAVPARFAKYAVADDDVESSAQKLQAQRADAEGIESGEAPKAKRRYLLRKRKPA